MLEHQQVGGRSGEDTWKTAGPPGAAVATPRSLSPQNPTLCLNHVVGEAGEDGGEGIEADHRWR